MGLRKSAVDMKDKIEELRRVKSKALQGGGERIQHDQGKLTARERIEKLLDTGSFSELNMLAETQCTDFGLDKKKLPGDGIVAGSGEIDGRLIYLFAQDRSVLGGSAGVAHTRKMADAVENATRMGVPFIGLFDSPGARIQEGIETLRRDAGTIYYSNSQASGIVPQISAILGVCSGMPAYSSALTDFVFMVDGISKMFITGPEVIKQVGGKEVSMEELGGAKVHAQITGQADFRAKSEEECFRMIRKLLSFLPSNCSESPLVIKTGDNPDRFVDDLDTVVPTDPKKSYDIHKVISALVDGSDFLEIKSEFARNLVTGFGRLDGITVGVVANQPLFYGGSITVDSSIKSARFIRFCDAFNIPLVFLMDVPGYFPGKDEEMKGIIRHGAKVLYAISESTVPKVCLILRKAYGGGTFAMGGVKLFGIDRVFAWPTAELAVMGAEGAVRILYKREIAEAKDREGFYQKSIESYRERFSHPYHAAAIQVIDDVIEPQESRRILIRALKSLRGKREWKSPRKHGNMPL